MPEISHTNYKKCRNRLKLTRAQGSRDAEISFRKPIISRGSILCQKLNLEIEYANTFIKMTIGFQLMILVHEQWMDMNQFLYPWWSGGSFVHWIKLTQFSPVRELKLTRRTGYFGRCSTNMGSVVFQKSKIVLCNNTLFFYALQNLSMIGVAQIYFTSFQRTPYSRDMI